MKIALIVNYYTSDNKERQREIDKCLINNLSLKWLDVHTIGEVPPYKTIHTLFTRPLYQDFFSYIRELKHGHPKGYTHYVISNSDIYFDESLLLINKMHPMECYALSRWDILPDGTAKHHAISGSQDCWIFASQPTVNKGGDYYLGLPGCDNRIAHDLAEAGFYLKNPSKSIKSYHLNGSNHHTYTIRDRIPKPYKFIRPCEL